RSRHGRLSSSKHLKLRAVYGAIAAHSSRNVGSQDLLPSCCAKATIWRLGHAFSDARQTLARGVKLNEPCLKRLQPVLVFGDDVFRRPGDEVGVAELRLDLGDFHSLSRDLLVETRPFGREI